MYFRVTDHYEDNINNETIEDNEEINEEINENENENLIECFVCYEFKTERREKPIKLYGQNYYVKHCVCDGFIHKKCLDKWFEQNGTCPICRNNIYENNNLIHSIVNYKKYGYIIYASLIIKNNIKFLFRHFPIIFFLIILHNLHLSILDILDFNGYNGYNRYNGYNGYNGYNRYNGYNGYNRYNYAYDLENVYGECPNYNEYINYLFLTKKNPMNYN
jgi:hypothetical protein